MAYEGLSERSEPTDVWSQSIDEEPEERVRDRLGIHGVWEVLLALAVVGVGFALYRVSGDVPLGGGTPSLLLLATTVGLVTAGAAWSLRGAVPNLAVGPIAVAAAVLFANQAQGGFGFGLGVTLGAAAVAGVLLALAVTILRVPAWAASLGLALALGAWLTQNAKTALPESVGYDPAGHALYWFAGFTAASVLGGFFSLIGPIRRGVGAFRATADPAGPRGFGPGFAALIACIGSCVLAAGAGLLIALTEQRVTPDSGLAWSGVAVGLALIGGVSAHGRRGGLLGTVLAVLLLVLVMRVGTEQQWNVPLVGYAAAALGVGLVVTRLVEGFGRHRARHRHRATDDDWSRTEVVLEGPDRTGSRDDADDDSPNPFSATVGASGAAGTGFDSR